MTIRVIDKKIPDALVVPLLQGEQLAGVLEEIAHRTGLDAGVLQHDFRADAKEIAVLYETGGTGRRVYLLGMGKKSGFQEVYLAARTFSFRNKTKLPRQVGIDLRHYPESDIPHLTEAIVTGMLVGIYNTGLYRAPAPDKQPAVFGGAKSELQLLVPSSAKAACETAAARGRLFAEVQTKVCDWMNTPGNYKTPKQMGEWAKAAADDFGFSVKILDHKAIQAEKLEALHAVGKGSQYPPALLLLEYGPKKSGKQKLPVIGLVGKGITFDTGGISIKPSTNMHLMKSDMGGAAAVLGAFMVAASLRLPVRLVGAIPTAENMVDAQAYRPGDVIGSFAGKTIEVTDTDAEGRLVLADGLAYLLHQQKPDALIDLATLTGSVIRALGNQAGGLFTKNDGLANLLAQAGDDCGERLWRMPMWDEYGSDLKSDVADLRNYTGKPMAECISAAKFLEHFTAEHPAWAHLDIAGMVFADSEFSQSRMATGYGVRLLITFMEKWIRQHATAEQ